MKKLLALTLAAVSLNVSAAGASSSEDPDSGNYWHIQCNQSGQSGKNQCIAFMIGFVRGAQSQALISKGKPLFCIPTGSTYEQAGDLFGKYLKDHPESRHKSASYLAMMALIGGYPTPCD